MLSGCAAGPPTDVGAETRPPRNAPEKSSPAPRPRVFDARKRARSLARFQPVKSRWTLGFGREITNFALARARAPANPCIVNRYALV